MSQNHVWPVQARLSELAQTVVLLFSVSKLSLINWELSLHIIVHVSCCQSQLWDVKGSSVVIISSTIPVVYSRCNHNVPDKVYILPREESASLAILSLDVAITMVVFCSRLSLISA